MLKDAPGDAKFIASITNPVIGEILRHVSRACGGLAPSSKKQPKVSLWSVGNEIAPM